MDKRETKITRDIIFSVVLSVVLSTMGAGTFLASVPLIVCSRAVKSTGKAVLMEVVAFVVSIGYQLYSIRHAIAEGYIGIVLVSLIFLVSQAVETVFYTAMRDKSDSILRKLVSSTFPVMLISLAFSIYFCMPSSADARTTLTGQFAATISNFGFAEENLDVMASMVIFVLVYGIGPMSMVIGSLGILIGEFFGRRFDQNFQDSLADMKMPKSTVWFYLLICVLFIIGLFAELPVYMNAVTANLFLGMSLHYFMNGYSVVLCVLRKKGMRVFAHQLLIVSVLLSMVPVVGEIVLVGYVLLAILENWIKIR